jgi:hypothetical protein
MMNICSALESANLIIIVCSGSPLSCIIVCSDLLSSIMGGHRPVDILQKILEERSGAGEKLRSFFDAYGAAEASAMAIVLAAAKPGCGVSVVSLCPDESGTTLYDTICIAFASILGPHQNCKGCNLCGKVLLHASIHRQPCQSP